MTVRKNTVESVNAKPSARRSAGLSFTKEQLHEFHWDRGLGFSEIGKMYGVTGGAIRYWFLKLGVSFRPQTQEPILDLSPTLSYVLGVLHGDGFLYKNFTNGNDEILLVNTSPVFCESFRNALQKLNLRAGVVALKRHPDWTDQYKDQWKVYANSKRFHQWWDAKSDEELIDAGLTHEADFLRGLYESDGCFSRGTWSICTPDRLTADRVLVTLAAHEWHPKFYSGVTKHGTPYWNVCLYRMEEIASVIGWMKPCIRTTDSRHANAEVSRGGNAPKTVENTKQPRPGLE